MAIVLCYFQLCNENYLWQWRSFLNTGSAGLFLFGYSFVYFSSTLEIMGVVSTMLYFCYMFITSMLFTLATGTVGFIASWWLCVLSRVPTRRVCRTNAACADLFSALESRAISQRLANLWCRQGGLSERGVGQLHAWDGGRGVLGSLQGTRRHQGLWT
jgi:hypothetical protein